ASSPLTAVGVVAGSLYTECKRPTAAIFIHGERDSVVPVSRGMHARDHFLSVNNCDTRSTPAAHKDCVQYLDCRADAPVWWCEHGEPAYENTNHGWPSFASGAIATFFETVSSQALQESETTVVHSRFDDGDDGWQASF